MSTKKPPPVQSAQTWSSYPGTFAMAEPGFFLPCGRVAHANYVFPKTWPADREQRARIIGEWLRRDCYEIAGETTVP